MWAKANLLAALAATAIGGCRALPHEHRGARSSPATTRASRPSVAELSRAIALTSELQYRQALAEFARLETGFMAEGRPARAAECLFWRGYCREKLSETSEAARIYRRLIRRHAKTPASAQAARRLTWMTARQAGTRLGP